MDSLVIAAIAFGCAQGGVILGVVLRQSLPESHLSGDSKDVIKQGFGLIATMVALVLGLLVASAKASFDSDADGFQKMSTDVIVLDRLLARYGPESEPARDRLRRAVASTIDRLWPPSGSGPAGPVDARESTSDNGRVLDAVRDLHPKTDGQRGLQSQSILLGVEFSKTRWGLSQPSGPLIPAPFLGVLFFWLTILFASYGLLAPPNVSVLATSFLCALSVAGAIFLVVDLGEPLGGLIRVSDAPLRYGLSQLGQD